MALTANDPNVINVKALGAKGDGSTDDSLAFQNAIAAAESAARRNVAPGSDSNQLGTVTIYVPAGSYVIKSAEAMIRSSYTTRTLGLQIVGAGAGMTQILFQPKTPGSYLMYNKDAWLFLHLADLTFDSNNSKNGLMRSYSTGGAQKYSVERCLFTGSWNYAFYLEGNNTNSEFTFYDCTWVGSYNKMFYVPASGSDQFVNYNFISCNFEVSQGDFLSLEKGGCVSVYGGSFIHTSGGGTFFRLLGNTHAYGTERFLCVGARIEHRSSTSVLVECEWANGSVTFLNVDASSSIPARSSTSIAAIFRSGNVPLPIIKFDNCRLLGAHQYQYYVNSWNELSNIRYENCTFEQHADPSTFISFTAADGNGNKGGQPVIHFTNCRGTNGHTNLWDCSYGYGTSLLTTLSLRTASIKSVNGKFPYKNNTSIGCTLPINAIITGVKLYWPTKVATSQSKTWTFTLRTSESSPTVLASVSGSNKTSLADGFLKEVSTFLVCDNINKRSLILECNAAVDQTIDGCLCLIEYLA
ncbi:hypothetical protein PghCCS26_38250 [Paenibacillus glycanilyticus]|uniref:Rhamnogalacturonase A/B/Epimerase-like pectate lyase domain-containing protein n=1 Tax=Paenibacillus glycanilyticus TaxID=126569 RepID=A0ABQ6NNL9_9BACL|nr:glycosyl hydrolase family 28-related protein [Paenibacillus glycanilyticus]GMK46696.1 hypothetical protein PghCCS26_38250 [Paenibacillus glycanilyticus]